MALIYDGMPCAICGEPIKDTTKPLFALTMWGITDARFVRLDDAAMHQACMDNWILRDEFIEFYNENCRDELRINRRGNVCYRIDWFDHAANIGCLTVFGFLFWPVILFAKYIPDDSCLIHSLVGLTIFALLVFASFFASIYFGAILGVAFVVGVWLGLGYVTFWHVRQQSP